MGRVVASDALSREERPVEGRFVRRQSRFREWVRVDGSSRFPAEPGRYHLYVSLACPWAHRAIILRKLKGLEHVIGMTVVDPIRDERGWAFTDGHDDPVNGFTFLSEAYDATEPDFDGRISVPVLWDTETETIVNNESEAVLPLFDTLAMLDDRLATRRYLFGDRQTLADWRLFTTLIRFDTVYAIHFKCTLRRIADHEHLPGYLRDLYQTPGVAETVDWDHIKRHYYLTHRGINPNGIVPVGPELDLDAPHGRDALG